jgi:hypothetical protein
MNNTLQTINVSAKSKFGVLDGATNKWFNPKDKELLASFSVGHSYNVELGETKKDGKTYLNIVKVVGSRGPLADVPVAEVSATAAPIAKAPYKAFDKPFNKFQKKTTSDTTMSKDEWKAKDRSQLIGGLSHDAAALAVAQYTTKGGTILDIYKEMLVGMLKIREEIK